jgi:leader peptidase (prepilin peptidase) / N-methyltransferase
VNFLDNMFDPRVWQAVPFHFWSLVSFAFGCIVGSFLNVVIHRLPLGQSIVSPPSHCPHCQYSIPAILNIPLITWLYLRGKCRNCGAPISIRYFLVELLTGVTFLACWIRFGDESAMLALVYGAFLAGLIAASFIDLEHFIIPDEITIGGAVVGLIVSTLLPRLQGQESRLMGLLHSFIGMLVGAGLIYAIVRAGKLVFGRWSLELDPDSRIVFGETGVQLPPKQLPLLSGPPGTGSGRFAVNASHVELSDRCLWDVTVAVSNHKLIIGSETFDRDSVPYLEMIVDHVLSAQQTAELFGEQASGTEIVAGWLAPFKRLIGIRSVRIEPGAQIVIAAGHLWLRRDEIPFEDMFYRKSDTIHFNARRVETSFGAWRDVPVRLSPERLQIGDATFNPEAIGRMEVVTDAMTVPREAMGLGDVKFMGAVGAFLGWPAVFFSLASSSLIGAVVGLTLIALARRDRGAKLQYGPCIAVGAAIWIFLPTAIQERWLWNLQLFGNFLFHTRMPDSLGP